MTERSNSFEQIELLPASPPSLEASLSSGGTTPARTVEKERGGEDIVKSKPAAQITHRRPASLLRKSSGRADAEGEKNAPSRYQPSAKKPFERGKSIQEIAVGIYPDDSERGVSPDDLTRSLRREMGGRFVHQRGSVRANFSAPNSPSLFSGFIRWVNHVGMEKRDYALFCLHKKGRTRRFCKKIMKSRIFKLFMSLVAILNSLALCFYQPVQNYDTKYENDIIAYTLVAFIVIYIIEVVLGIIAYTCIIHPQAYLRRGWSLLDLAVILFGILYVSMYTHVSPWGQVFADLFACLMSLKLIKILSFFESVQFILKVLGKLVLPLFYLSIFTLLVMYFFALVGMQLFSGNLHGGCYSSYRTPSGRIEEVLVSAFPCKLCTENSSLDVDLHICPNKSVCKPWEEGPNSGITSFDNFLVSFVTVFQVMTLEGWSQVFYLFESAVGITYPWVYFFIVVVVGSVLILNLWIGVLTSVFIGVSDREESHYNIRMLKEKKRIDDDFANYKEWLTRATELDLPSDTASIGRRPSHDKWLGGEPSPDSGSDSDDDIGSIRPPHLDDAPRLDRGCWEKSQDALRKVVKSKVFFLFDLFVHAVNLLFLMSIHFPQRPEYDTVVTALNYVFSLWYITEVCLRMHAYGLKTFFTKKPMERIIVVCLSLLSILSPLQFIIRHPFFGTFNLIFIVNAVWSLKLIEILKLTSYWKAMKEILSTFFQLLNLILSLIGILGVFTLIFTTLGVRIFGERMRFQVEDYPSFDNFYRSFLLVFQLLTSEDWHNQFYSYVGPYRREDTALAGFAAVYFVATIVIGNLILLSVFLAIAVDKLSEVRSLEEDTIEATEKLMERRKEREEQICALKNPDQPQVQRRTIRRVMRYLAENPSERVKQMHQTEAQKKKRKRQVGLQRENKRGMSLIHRDRGSSGEEYRRSISAPGVTDLSPTLTKEDSVSPPPDSGEGKAATVTFRSDTATPKQRNPLRLMKRRSNYFELQKMRLGGWPPSSSSDSAQSSVVSSIDSQAISAAAQRQISGGQAVSSVDEDSVFDVESPRLTERNLSVASTPESSKPIHPLMISYERTQSSPGTIPSMSEVNSGRAFTLDVIEERNGMEIEREVDDSGDGEGVNGRRNRILKQDTLDEGDGVDIDGYSDGTQGHSYSRSFSPSHLQLPTDYISQRLHRESSLEAVHPVGLERRASQMAQSAKTKLKRRLYQVWDWIKDYSGTMVFNPANELKEMPLHSSFFILAPDNRLRQFCFRLVRYQSFETISYTVVLLSSVLLALEIPVGVDRSTDSELCSFQLSLIFLDGIIVAYFLIEMFLKVIALGLILHRGSYMRSFFNIIDCFVVISSLIPIVYYIVRSDLRANNTSDRCFAHLYEPNVLPIGISVLRVFRVLRPFRAVRISGLYLVVTGLISSIKSMGSILFVTILVLIVFAVTGVSIFRGRFYYCTDPSVSLEASCRGYYYSYDYSADYRAIPDLSCPEVKERVWKIRDLHFSHVGHAILTLFTMITGEGWQNVMYSGVNSVPPLNSTTPVAGEPYASPESAIYFIIYMSFMTFILLQLFIGVVIVTFQEVGVKSFRDAKLDRNQRNCLYFALTAKPTPQYLPKFECHRKVHDWIVPLLNHWLVKGVVVAALLANCILLAFQVNNNEERYQYIFFFNVAFTAVFVGEAFIKIIAFTPPIYFRNVWNVFEFLIEFFAILELIVVTALPGHTFKTEVLSNKLTMIASTFRVLRLLRFIPQVRLILWTVFQSLEIFPWVGYLLGTVIFMFTVLGMQLFGTIKIASVDESDITEITQYNNFSNFFRAFFVMIRVLTGENWPLVMISCLRGQACELTDTSDCGDNFAYVFFPAFYIVTTILILNLFVAIIIDNFDYIVRDRSILGAHQLGLFVKLWSVYDPLATGKISPENVIELMRKCNPPVGWGKLCPQTVAYKKMMNLNMPVVDGQVTFNATLFALVRTTLKVQCQGCPECATKCNIDLKKKLLILFPTMAEKQINDVLPKEDDETIGKKYAALLIQHIWRSRAARTRKVMEMFQGSQGMIRLKTGPRTIPDAGPDLVRHRTADFAADLALPSPTERRKSEVSSMGTSMDRDTDSPLYRGPLSPSSLTGFEFGGMAALSEHQPWRRSTVTSQTKQLPQLPETVEEESASHHEDRHDIQQIEEDLQSELSFASAYSDPRDLSDVMLQRMESTV